MNLDMKFKDNLRLIGYRIDINNFINRLVGREGLEPPTFSV